MPTLRNFPKEIYMDSNNKKNEHIEKPTDKTSSAPKDNPKAIEDKELDKKLKDTFPASDSTAEY